MECLILQNEVQQKQVQSWDMDEEIQIFREYLRFPTVHPNIDYRESQSLKVKIKIFLKFRFNFSSAMKVKKFFTHDGKLFLISLESKFSIVSSQIFFKIERNLKPLVD